MASSCCNLCCAADKFACSDATLASACALAASAEWSWPNTLASTIGNRYLRRMRLRCAGRKIRFCMFELSRVVPRIELHQQCSRFHELVILHSRIDVNDRSADPRAHQVQMHFNLGIIGGLVSLRVDPPKGGSGDSNRRRKKKDPPRKASSRDLARGFRPVAGKLCG